ncbi:adenylate/guanylate cyclase domain-containing protein [Aromatoleum anaerobium]|uniref:Adenylate/guanylate cyclase domain-containing protein n=1 Tax=Aromatoleum anaerobium TaxID=182180 RepID=A0ABX1PNI8_9RHOO|nr:adenylate/guanylate cyclase domain-containing protein [Aromatoleum anaerobium]MCK0509448.1 adenylate/guanylate cyclase domain-containing protein [Aromatoleum anaerobium]
MESASLDPAPTADAAFARLVATLARRLAALRPASSAALPARVRDAIAREQYRSELLVTAVQLAIAALLALLYAGTPRGFAPDAPVEAAPLGLSLFAILSLVRLYFALTGQLGRGLLGFTVVAEMAVLMSVIFAYHLQYEQPPQLSLKSTEFAYVFMLIALRALRFEAVWVVLSGLTAAASWVALVAWSVASATANPVTWDYVTSLRSFQIHYGGEFDKLLAILVVTAMLAFSLARARQLLADAVAREQAVADLSLFFDDSVAARITGSEAEVMAGQGELREAAILFLDLRGFTAAAARLSPDALIALLGDYQGLVLPIIKAHGGSIDKFMGDGILASFGAVRPDPQFAANALRATDAIRLAVDRWRAAREAAGLPAPDVGAGLATGAVVFGIIGHARRLEYTVIGDAVNLAAKLEKHNKVERTRGLATRTAYELAREQGYRDVREILARRRVGGVAAPLDLVALGGERGTC